MPCEGRALRRPSPAKAEPCKGRALWNWQGVPSLLMYKMPLKFHRLKTPRDFMLPHSSVNSVLPVMSLPPFPRWRKLSELKEGTSTVCQSRPDVEESWASVHKHSCSSLVASVCCWTSPLPSANCPWVRECSGFQLTIGLYFQDSAARWLPLDLTKGLWVLRFEQECSHRLKCLYTWSPTGGAAWEVVELWDSGALQEGVGHWGQALKF